MAELRRRRDEVSDADLVEIRLDTASDPDAAAALSGRRTPIIVTCRPTWEGGQFQGSEEERMRLLRDAQQLGADYIDVEWKAGFRAALQVQPHGKGIVLSMHDFAGVPHDLADRARAMASTGAEVIKIAVTATKLADCIPLLSLARTLTVPATLTAMGDAGIVTRVLAARFNSCWTYAGDQVAPGQMSLARLRDDFSFRRLTGKTDLYGVVGRPIMHSLSPAMHNAAFRAVARDAVYLPLAATDYDDFMHFAGALDLRGASVTAPFKPAAFSRTAVPDAVSELTRSVNTVRRVDGRWEGRNTDAAGFLTPLDEAAVELRGKRAIILGAGGAARAVVHALQSRGARVQIAARRRKQASDLAQEMACGVTDWPPPADSWDLLVNTTPIGTTPAVEDTPLPGGPLTGELVYDLVYNPSPTKLLRDAAQAGCRTIGGLAMLVAQAERQFEWWTGLTPPAGIMRDAARRALESAAALVTPSSQVPGVHHS
jgi:3-dehydroquinate dehydratase/shikimate dehydrogenase